MPNWTDNRVTVHGNPQSIDEFKQFVCDKDRPFSLNRIIPRPEAVENVDSGSMVAKGLEAIKKHDEWMNDLTPRARNHTRRAIANLCVFGAKDWYDWSRRFWGTKWDTCDCKLMYWSRWEYTDEGVKEPGAKVVYEFRTAWSAPKPIATVLRAMFPELDIHWLALDEDGAFIRNEQQPDESACDAWVKPDLDEHPNAYEI